MSKSHKHVTEEAARYDNISDSLDYEIRGRRKRIWEGRWILAHRDLVVRATSASILAGTFRPGRYKTSIIRERGKVRQIQSVSLLRSIGIHAVMTAVEARIDPTFVSDTAASIKGRGCHYLLRRVVSDMRRDPAGTRYTYKDDIHKFYQCTSQDLLMRIIRQTFRDRRLNRILERFVRLLPEGISIGLRSSQGLENLLLSVLSDHIMKDQEGVRYYRRYCDDRVIQHGDKHRLTGYIRTAQKAVADAGLTLKSSCQMWPTASRSVDFLGYRIAANGKVSLRKTTKQRFARRWHRVRSRRRRQELIGSFCGACRHGHCRHLFRSLTGISMTRFSEIGFIYQRNGKRDFSARKISLREITNEEVTVTDFETGIKTGEGDDRYIVVVQSAKIGERKFFTNNDKMKKALDMAREKNMLPFDTVIKADGGYGYMFT